MLSSSKVLTARVGCPLGKKTDDIFSYINLFPPTVVAMEVMSHVARHLKFIVGADLLSKFQCNETAVEDGYEQGHTINDRSSVKG